MLSITCRQKNLCGNVWRNTSRCNIWQCFGKYYYNLVSSKDDASLNQNLTLEYWALTKYSLHGQSNDGTKDIVICVIEITLPDGKKEYLQWIFLISQLHRKCSANYISTAWILCRYRHNRPALIVYVLSAIITKYCICYRINRNFMSSIQIFFHCFN